MIIDWDEREAAVARLALSQLSYATDTGAERAVIAGMLADLVSPASCHGGQAAGLRERGAPRPGYAETPGGCHHLPGSTTIIHQVFATPSLPDMASDFHWDMRRVLFNMPGTPEVRSPRSRGSALTVTSGDLDLNPKPSP